MIAAQTHRHVRLRQNLDFSIHALINLGHNAYKSVALCDELVLSKARCDKPSPLF